MLQRGQGTHITCHLWFLRIHFLIFCIILRQAPKPNQWTDFDNLYVIRHVSALDSAFWVSFILGVKSPKRPILKAGIDIFKPNVQKIKNLHIIKTAAPIPTKFHSNKDHQILFVWGPNMREANPRWRTDAILEKSKNDHISATV